MRTRWGMSLLLVVSVFVVYRQVGDFEFVTWDDNIYVTDNPHVRSGLSKDSLIYAFTNLDFGHWHPVTWVSHMAAYELVGLNPALHHWINVFLHAASSVLLFLVLLRMTAAFWRSAFVAALFALHPLHVESVAWVTERKDVLSALFGFLALWAYLRYVEKRDLRRYWWIAFFLILSLMSKPMLVTLPAIFMLLDYWPLGRIGFPEIRNRQWRRSLKRLLVEKLPLFGISCASAIMTLLAGKAVVESRFGSIESYLVPADMRIPNALISYMRYILKMLWPLDLAAIYPYPLSPRPLWQVLLAALVLTMITFLIFRYAKSARYLLVGWLWYLGTLLPVSGLLVQAGPQAMADRYTYLPLIGLFIILAWGVPDLLGRFQYDPGSGKATVSFSRAPLAVLGSSVLLCLMMVSRHQVGTWRNTISLFERAVAVTDGNWLAQNNLGLALYRSGKTREAISHYEEALRIRPRYDTGHNNLAIALDDEGKIDEAIIHLREAIQINPKLKLVHFNLGVALNRQGKKDEAIPYFQEELNINPIHVQSHNQLGILRLNQGRIDEAVGHFSRALSIDPSFANAHFNLGVARAAQGKLDKTISHYNEAIRLNPTNAKWRRELGGALVQQGRLDDALTQYSEALRIDPEYAEAYNSLAATFFLKGDYAGAWEKLDLCRKYGGQPSPSLLSALSRRMPEPPN